MPTTAGLYFAQFDEGRKDEPPVIFLHGAGSSHLVWPAALRRLPGQRVLAVDLPGHGRSPGVAQQTIAGYTQAVMEFLSALGVYEAVFVGHSMGGAVALDLAVRYPAHVAGLGLIGTGAYLGVERGFLENLSHPLTAPAAIASFASRAFSPQAPSALIEQTIQTMRAVRHSVLYGDWRACASFDQREHTQRITAPTWVIVGSEDRITPMAYAHFLAERIPAARLDVVNGAGHMVFLEQPARVAQGLQQFLSALAATRYTAARLRVPAPAPAAPSIKEQAAPAQAPVARPRARRG